MLIVMRCVSRFAAAAFCLPCLVRTVCTSKAWRGTCQLPPRALYHRDARSLGWGLFVQNHGAVPSYHALARGGNFSRGLARQFDAVRCRQRIGDGVGGADGAVVAREGGGG